MSPFTPAGTVKLTSTPAPTAFPLPSLTVAVAVYVVPAPLPAGSGPAGSISQVDSDALGAPAVKTASAGEPETASSAPEISTVAAIG